VSSSGDEGAAGVGGAQRVAGGGPVQQAFGPKRSHGAAQPTAEHLLRGVADLGLVEIAEGLLHTLSSYRPVRPAQNDDLRQHLALEGALRLPLRPPQSQSASPARGTPALRRHPAAVFWPFWRAGAWQINRSSRLRQPRIKRTYNGPMSYATARRRQGNADLNKLYAEDRPVHEWYRFVLSFPPHLVRQYVERLGFDSSQRVLDPFCGTGTVLVECKKLGIPSVGVEANPLAHFASRVKLDWRPDPAGLLAHAQEVALAAQRTLAKDDLDDDPRLTAGREPRALRQLPPEAERLLLADSISPLPLHKTLVLLDCLDRHHDDRYREHELLALAKSLVLSISNLHFGPEVGVGPAKRDAAVIAPWLTAVSAIGDDLALVGPLQGTPGTVHLADSRHLRDVLEPESIDGIITSPPYPNEKDYTRTTRLESVLLGFIHNRADLRALKQGLLRSNTRNVYKADDDDEWVAAHPEIQRVADAIEARRVELGKTSGFERLYGRVTRLYFGGMARHLADLRSILRPGARLAYVVGDQASYLQVMIRTGALLTDIARALGYDAMGTELFRTRRATATRGELREEVVVLRWPGTSHPKARGAPSARIRLTTAGAR
jgi:hypothetical protein